MKRTLYCILIFCGLLDFLTKNEDQIKADTFPSKADILFSKRGIAPQETVNNMRWRGNSVSLEMDQMQKRTFKAEGRPHMFFFLSFPHFHWHRQPQNQGIRHNKKIVFNCIRPAPRFIELHNILKILSNLVIADTK